MNKYICIIPARNGSKRLPNKNIKELNKIPMIVYSIKAALDSKLFDNIYVATDDIKIANISRKNGATVPFLIPVNLCEDNIASHIPCQYLIDKLKQKYQTLVCLQPTSPLRSNYDIIMSVQKYEKNNYNFLVSSTLIDPHYFHWALLDNDDCNMYFGKKYMKERIYLENVYRPNGSIKIANINELKNHGNFFGNKLGMIEIPEERSIHVATQYEFDIAEFFLQKNKTEVDVFTPLKI